MKILANRKIKFLFCSILSCILVFVLISTVLVNLDVRNTVYYIIFCSVCMGAAILLFCYGYFKEQHKIMENAAEHTALFYQLFWRTFFCHMTIRQHHHMIGSQYCPHTVCNNQNSFILEQGRKCGLETGLILNIQGCSRFIHPLYPQ